MQKLGILDLPIIQNLNDIQKGKLIGYLLNRNIDNTENNLRYRNGKNPPLKYSLQLERVQAPVLELLKEVGLENFEKL